MKKIFIGTILISITLLALSGMWWYFSLLKKADLLVDHYPVFDKDKKQYTLVKKRPTHWVDIKQISKELQYAIVVSEDWAFFDHDGIDRNQIRIVINESIKAKKLVRGASTITQQVVKNALLTNERSLMRKFKEILLALEVEKKLEKSKILEHYLNLIELGKDVYGVKNGSEYYFKKLPSKINAKEGAFLAMLLPSPKKYSQSFDKKELTKFAKEQVQSILKKMKQAKYISEEKRKFYQNLKLNFEKGLDEENFLYGEHTFDDEAPILDEKEQEMFKKEDVEANNNVKPEEKKFIEREDELDLLEEPEGEY